MRVRIYTAFGVFTSDDLGVGSELAAHEMVDEMLSTDGGYMKIPISPSTVYIPENVVQNSVITIIE